MRSDLGGGNLEARLKLLIGEWSHQKEKGLPLGAVVDVGCGVWWYVMILMSHMD